MSIKKFINVYNTNYYLYPSRLEKRFEFFSTKTFYIPYDQIVDMKIEASFWDRICGVSDIKVIGRFVNNLGEEGDKYAMLVKDIKNSIEFKNKIIKKIREHNK